MLIEHVLAVAVVAASGAAPEKVSDVDIVGQRVVAQYVSTDKGKLASQAKRVGAWLSTLQDDGSWPGVDYADKSRTSWGAAPHLSRIREMAIAYTSPEGPLYQDIALGDALSRALDYWFAQDPRNPNWWWNEIGPQLTLGPALVLLRNELTPEQRAKGVEIMKRSKWKSWTGQNLVWGTTIQIMRGCVEGSEQTVQEAYDRFYKEIYIAPPGKEGIQVDFSFHQHGPQLYSGGYGLGFATNCAQYAHYARGTQFAPPPDVLDALTGYILDGQQWMMRGTTFDYSAVGREIVRPGKNGSSMRYAASLMAELTPKRRDEFKAFASRIGSNGREHPLSGNRMFWRSDYIAHQRPGYFASVRMASKRNRRSEVCNDEGRRSHHLADGVMMLYRTGDEYRDIFPAWDWQRLPGVTCEQCDWADKGRVGGVGETSFVGGVSDGDMGLAAMDFQRGALSAKKAWFFFDDIVCLGAGITCTSDNPVLTSVNQCLSRGPAIGGGQWAHHNEVGYVFLDESVHHEVVQKQEGQWTDIGTAARPPVSVGVFSTWLDHGVGPKDASYAYIVYPDVREDRMDTLCKSDNITVLSNTPALQAVECNSAVRVQAAFWEPGSVEWSGGRSLSVDQPCLVMARCVPNEMRLAVSNPLNTPLTVNIETSLPLKGEGCEPTGNGGTRIRLELPDGPYAGSSLGRTFKKR